MYKTLLSQRGLSLDRLSNFCLIADAGGISKAANGDPAKQSLFSRQIRELEEFFGVELTAREGKRVILTEEGRRLARLVREQLQALTDFRSECQKGKIVFKLAAGNSVLEWMVLPKLGAIHESLPNTHIDLVSQRTQDTTQGLTDMTIDFGIIRKDAVPKHLKSVPLGTLHYALYVTREQAAKTKSKDVGTLLGQLRLATSKSETLNEFLETAARKDGVTLHVDLSCSSFTQALRALQSGKYAAILPTIAASDLPKDQYVEIELPFLKNHKRNLSLVWNPRTASVRPIVARAVKILSEVLEPTEQFI